MLVRKAPLTWSEPVIFGGFLPDFFSQTNSLCLEDFLCYSKTITYVRHETFSLVLNSQIWANLGSEIWKDSVCNKDNTKYKLGRHLFLSQLEKAKTFVRRSAISENNFMKKRKFQRWFKIWSTYLPVLFNLLLLWGRRIYVFIKRVLDQRTENMIKNVIHVFCKFFFCVVLQMGKIHTVDENLSLVVEKFSIQSKNTWICRLNPFQWFAICHLRIQFFSTNLLKRYRLENFTK